jgi:hypothetical protein
MNQDQKKTADKKRDKGFQTLGTLFDSYEVGKPGKYISQEFQDFGYRLALELDDLKHKSLYIKLAKNEDRGLLEAARRFVIDADHARSKGRLFMWKLKELKQERLKK